MEKNSTRTKRGTHRLSGVGLLLVLMAFPKIVWGAGLSVTPMLQEVVLEGMQREEASVVITNETEVVVHLEVSAIDFQGLDRSGGIAFLGATGIDQAYSLAAWMRPDRTTLSLFPNESQTIKVGIENDATLSPGGHYGALVLKQVAAGGGEDTSKITLQQLFTALFFVKKTGGAEYGLALEHWDDKQALFRLFEPQTLVFRATGNVHVVPRGEVHLRDPLGRLMAKGVINEASALILPGTVRDYSVRLVPVLAAWVPGRYQLSLQYRYDGRSDVETHERSVVYIPPRTVVVFVGMIFLLVGRGILRRRFFVVSRVSCSSQRT